MSKEPKRIKIDTENAKGRTAAEIRASGYLTEEEKRLLFEAVNSVLSVIQAPEYQELLKDAEERERLLLPFIEKVLTDPKNRRKYKGITAAEVLENLDVMGRVVNPGEISAEIQKGHRNRKEHQRHARSKGPSRKMQRQKTALRFIMRNATKKPN